jgi:ABC-type bacteriocin/lantibiotic exporter with double-glycine peptidase domain
MNANGPWPSPLRRGHFRTPFSGADFPASLPAFIWRTSAWDQLWLAGLSLSAAVLDTAPIEVQRRILNATARRSGFDTILELALLYIAIVATEGLIKLVMRIYSGWVSEYAVRSLRAAIGSLIGQHQASAEIKGVQVAMILSESEPVGGFVGDCVSEPLLQGGILFAVFGYMSYLQPIMALVSLAVFSPQFVFVPLMQRAINRRDKARVAVLRQASASVIDEEREEIVRAVAQEVRFGEIFHLNMGIFRLKFTMNFLMNLTHQIGLVAILTVGAWFVLHGSTQIGTIIAFVSGLRNVNDPWGDLVNWFQNVWVTKTKYDMVLNGVSQIATPQAAP